MALAHERSDVPTSPRLRIQLFLCELQQSGKPGTYRLLQQRLGMSSGSFGHHIDRLVAEGLVTKSRAAGSIELTPLGVAGLIADGWLVPARPAIAYELSTRAVEALETTPAREDGAS